MGPLFRKKISNYCQYTKTKLQNAIVLDNDFKRIYIYYNSLHILIFLNHHKQTAHEYFIISSLYTLQTSTKNESLS